MDNSLAGTNRLRVRIPPVVGRWLVVILATILLVMVAGTTTMASDNPEVVWTGVVQSVPDSETGVGRYIILQEDGEQRKVFADDDTEFHDDTVPATGQSIEAKGHEWRDGGLLAERIKIEDGGVDPDDGHASPCADAERSEWKGIVVSRPQADRGPVGDWTIAVGDVVLLTARVTSTTRFDRGVPQVGGWVELKGEITDAEVCRVLVRRMRPDDIEGGQVVIRLRGDARPKDIADDSAYDLTFVKTLLRTANIHLFVADDDEADEIDIVDQLQDDARIEWAELNYVGGIPESDGYKTWGWGGEEESGYQNQAAFEQVNLAPALERASGAGITVAILDTGVDATHPALSGRMLAGRDMVDDDDDPREESGGVAWGHGTHVSGIVAAVAPDATLLPVRVLDSNGRGNMFTLAYAIEWAVDQGVDVINLSLGSEVDSRVLEEAVAAAVDVGVVVVAAAGNSGDNVVQYPAGFPDVISVTAVDGEGVKADFASFGSQWVDVAAPGVGIVSPVPDYDADGIADYSAWSGTSMSSPFASGAAALIKELSVDSTSGQVEELFTASAANLDSLNIFKLAGQLGGLLNIGDAVEAASPETPEVPEVHEVFLPVIVNP